MINRKRGIRKPFVIGERYGIMTCLEGPFGSKNPYSYKFRCDCGAEVEKTTAQIKASPDPSCGCLASAAKARNGRLGTTHGMTCANSPELVRKIYSVHRHMMNRCYNPRSTDFKFWGQRGIIVCDEWHDPLAFAEWAFSSGYTHNVTIERVNNDGNYEPNNCAWIPNEHQARNTRKIRWLDHAGKRQSVADWSRETGIPYRTIMSRIRYGFSIQRTLTP